MKCVNITLWDILGCFHYIFKAPRNKQQSGFCDNLNMQITNPMKWSAIFIRNYVWQRNKNSI